MTIRAQGVPGAVLAVALSFVCACGPAAGWHVDAYNTTAEALIFRVSSSGPALSWKVNPGESVAILNAGSPLVGQISLLDPGTCAVVASATLPTKPGIISAIYGPTPLAVAIEFAPDSTPVEP